MNLLIFSGAIVFILAVVVLAQKAFKYSHQRLMASVKKTKRSYEDLLNERKDLSQQKMTLVGEADKIFTLYNMTKEITQKIHENEAFIIFKEKIFENVKVRDCRFLDTHSPELTKMKKPDDHFLFILKGEKKKIGYLVFEGLAERDKDKAIILGHQFALALRRVKLGQEIERLAITDSLTDLYTRHYFMERFEEELKRSQLRKIYLSFMMIDVDHFKRLNDKYGHLTGDKVLKEVGAIIKENIREIDIAGRYGGEEFCVVLPDTDREGAHFAGERIRAAIDQAMIEVSDRNLNVTVSVGLSTFPQDSKAIQGIIDKADWALYRAKKSGRNRICAFGVYEE